MVRQRRESTHHARDFLKCDRCRNDNKKCSPSKRDWLVSQQKCCRCERLGHACGPPVRKPKSNSADMSGATKEAVPTASLILPPESVIFGSLGENIHSPALTNSKTRHGKATDISSLAAMVSTHEILKSRLSFLETTAEDTRIDLTKVALVRRFLESLVKQVCTAFERAERMVEKQLLGMDEQEREMLCWKMAALKARRHSLLNTNSLSAPSTYIFEGERWLTNMPLNTSEAGLLLCTSRIFTTSHVDSYIPPDRIQLKMNDYLALQSHITNLFGNFQYPDLGMDSSGASSVLDDPQQQPYRTFPASHIAYWNHDRDVAFRLWKYASGHQPNPDADVIGSSFLHIVAASEDLQTLQNIVKESQNAVWFARRDQLGLYPIDLVKGLEFNPVRAFLCCHGAVAALSEQIYSMPSPTQLTMRLTTHGLPRTASLIRSNQLTNNPVSHALTDLGNIDVQRFVLQDLPATDSDNATNFGGYTAANNIQDAATYHVYSSGDNFTLAHSSDDEDGFMDASDLQSQGIHDATSHFRPWPD